MTLHPVIERHVPLLGHVVLVLLTQDRPQAVVAFDGWSVRKNRVSNQGSNLLLILFLQETQVAWVVGGVVADAVLLVQILAITRARQSHLARQDTHGSIDNTQVLDRVSLIVAAWLEIRHVHFKKKDELINLKLL